jgi:hypothetical protein
MKTEALFQFFISNSIQAISINYSKPVVSSYVSELRSLMIGSDRDRSMIAKVRNVVHAG